ncbi:tRNA lysidine(34) synthetase TilS [Chloroflexota bacterium]
MKKIAYQEPLEPKVLQFIRENHLTDNQRKLLVAVSGGPDSVCLLHILNRLRETLGIELYIAHLDHRLRDVDSTADASYVSQLARRLGIPATVKTRNVRDYHARQHTSLEEAAREVRYNFLAEVAQSIGADCVVTGHTSDDNVETILMHLIRGTGTRGLRGIQPVNRWQSSENSISIIRPLLPVSRRETIDFCRRHRLRPRIDTSNFSMSPLRNKIRHQLIPLLESYNPRINEALLRTARIAGDDLASLDKQGAWFWGSIAQRQGEVVVFEKNKFLTLLPALQRHLLRKAIEELTGSLKNIKADHIEKLIVAAGKPAGKQINLPEGLIFLIEYKRCILAKETEDLTPYPWIQGETALKIPGKTMVSGWRVAATIKGKRKRE